MLCPCPFKQILADYYNKHISKLNMVFYLFFYRTKGSCRLKSHLPTEMCWPLHSKMKLTGRWNRISCINVCSNHTPNVWTCWKVHFLFFTAWLSLEWNKLTNLLRIKEPASHEWNVYEYVQYNVKLILFLTCSMGWVWFWWLKNPNLRL